MKKLLLVFAAFAALVSCKNAVKDADSEYAVDMFKKGEVLPAFSLEDRSGTVRTQADFAGKYVVYDFWATWCPDCREDVPAMKDLYAKYGDKVTFVGISFDTDPEKLDAFVAENGIGWTQLSDFVTKKESKVAEDFRVKWIPSMYLVAPDGKVLLGTVMVSKLALALEAL
ncbi:MAG: TlpA family protein disulfide reductase [Bacteroidales bacterium]|jgi:peroxiredoxin|nr:TlpA family protein disulfide reductase [Bacteroidales bacterium]MBR2228315.1 TlpA family protein disulfide reductase [Bacteroidales bacterium]MBR4687718.1 TlpA family protein disulfide reductase [Bacteroidales bacterium]